MSSLPFVFGAAASSRVVTAAAGKGTVETKQEKSFVDWLLGKITKEDQFYETDPILRGGDVKSSGSTSGKKGGTTSGKKGTVSIPSKKKNGNGGVFGGLFAKKD